MRNWNVLLSYQFTDDVTKMVHSAYTAYLVSNDNQQTAIQIAISRLPKYATNVQLLSVF